MGNFLRKSSNVHPVFGDGGRGENVEAGEKKGHLRIKVRMRRDKLEELLYLARRGDQSDGEVDGGQMGFLILKECMEGRLPVTVLSSDDDVSPQQCENYLVSRRLSSIKEE
ncbi:hypothetical protein Rs2_23178 [Raphanus sativus]|uniref:Uncharacterized protein LOC108860896 n=1 Tax=Raphanus sativus TaxID=3726 RepID=A0A6J0P147_RAPSA|nr:uncharacterized protein LOC108860896 [Raphanus sativus]KAJ4896384.1 hypothetical protein Rs2_23178 [Raphanus sativus]